MLMSQDEEKMFTVKEVADQLRVDEKTVRRWIQKGDLIALNVGGIRPDYRISSANLQDFKLRRQTGKQDREER
jgi:excisionase family DNA binding protein